MVVSCLACSDSKRPLPLSVSEALAVDLDRAHVHRVGVGVAPDPVVDMRRHVDQVPRARYEGAEPVGGRNRVLGRRGGLDGVDKSIVLNYDTGDSSPMINADGFTGGSPIFPGEVKTLRATFKAPKDAKKVGITLSGIGTFDDVELGQ